jgi:error-prone DNA polymerase
VVEVALIRPGPIQGGSVHPYIDRREAMRNGTWGNKPFVEHPAMDRALRKTLGIPLFQEQLMELAVDVAGFNAGEADQLRRAMGSKRSTQKMRELRERLYTGMREKNGITGDLADSIYERLQAFANFGFAESHALSFASLVFYSAYLKLHHPAAFCAALLRAQPMGFYSPQSLVADARRHGVTVRRPHINHSGAPAGLESGAAGDAEGKPAVRLGLAGIRTIGDDLAEKIVATRPEGGYPDLESLMSAVTMSADQAEALATAGALDGLGERGPAAGQRSDRGRPAGHRSGGRGRANGSSPHRGFGADRGDHGLGPDRRHALWSAGASAALRPGMLRYSLAARYAPRGPAHV